MHMYTRVIRAKPLFNVGVGEHSGSVGRALDWGWNANISVCVARLVMQGLLHM